MPADQLDKPPNSRGPWIARCFGIDPRTLAVFRMAIGVLLLVDLAIRASDLSAMYSGDGVMPMDAVKSFFASGWRWSIHWLNATVEFQALLFVVAAVFALMFLLGYRTRWATIACWILLASLHNRGPLVINAGDTLMRLLLFWGMFLPLGRAWSLDAGRRRKDPAAAAVAVGRQPVVSVASAAILLQVCLVYWFTAIFKFEAGWGAGPGLQNALEWGGYNKPLAELLLRAPALMSALSIATVWLELIGPALLFLPWRQARLRGLVIVAFWVLHAGIELAMHVGLFSYISMAAWLLFIPREFWSQFGRPENLADEQIAGTEAVGSGPAAWKFAQPLAQYVCALLLGCVMVCNIYSVLNRRYERPTPRWLVPVRDVLMLRQQWSMFARPMNASSWFVAEAQLEDGSKVDVLRSGAAVDRTRPARIAQLYPNHRWRKFCNNLSVRNPNPGQHKRAQFPAFSQAFAKYWFRTWNAEQPAHRRIKVLKLICILQAIGPDTGGEYGEFVDAVVVSDRVEIEETISWPEWQMQKKPDPREEGPDL